MTRSSLYRRPPLRAGDRSTTALAWRSDAAPPSRQVRRAHQRAESFADVSRRHPAMSRAERRLLALSREGV